MTVNRLDDGLFVRIVAYGSSRFHDAARQGGLRNDAAGP